MTLGGVSRSIIDSTSPYYEVIRLECLIKIRSDLQLSKAKTGILILAVGLLNLNRGLVFSRSDCVSACVCLDTRIGQFPFVQSF
jgi:hypothetical protein